MKKDYLWDRSGEPDPEIERLENQLRVFRYDRAMPDLREWPMAEHQIPWHAGIPTWFAGRLSYVAIAVAAVVLLCVGVWWHLGGRQGYEVVSLDGTPVIGTARVSGEGRLGVGGWLETDAVSRARIRVGRIGQVEVEPNTRVGLVQARPAEHRMSLDWGTMHAYIWAAPRQFFVNTSSAEVVDYGCSYTLKVENDGTGTLIVKAGWVAFEKGGRESFVPAGAMCKTTAGIGPGTPFRADASVAFSEALEAFDFEPGPAVSRATALSAVLAEARRGDALTLWHLLFRVSEAERTAVYERLSALIPPPPGVTRERILARDSKALDLWWNELGLGGIEWWRMWKMP